METMWVGLVILTGEKGTGSGGETSRQEVYVLGSGGETSRQEVYVLGSGGETSRQEATWKASL